LGMVSLNNLSAGLCDCLADIRLKFAE